MFQLPYLGGTSRHGAPHQYTIDDRTALFGRPASAPVLALDQQQIFQVASFRLGEIAPAQACLQKAALKQPMATGSILAHPVAESGWRLQSRLSAGVIALVEVIEGGNATEPLLVAEFDFLPRVGEHLARDTDGYFHYYQIVKVWHWQDTANGAFRACELVTLDD